jgi:hypothetical protein
MARVEKKSQHDPIHLAWMVKKVARLLRENGIAN